MFFSQICDVAYAAVTADKTANNNRSMLVRIDDRGAIAIAGGTAGDKNSTAKEQGNGSIAIGWKVTAVKNGDIAIGGKDDLATKLMVEMPSVLGLKRL